jgi:hypothetical protein
VIEKVKGSVKSFVLKRDLINALIGLKFFFFPFLSLLFHNFLLLTSHDFKITNDRKNPYSVYLPHL